jgi:hypothetical protein
MPEDTFNWDVLTFLGSSLLILELLHEQPREVWLATAGSAFVIAPLLRQLARYETYWTQGWFDPEWTLSDTLIGYFATGYFPLFPWIVFPLIGASAADWVGTGSNEDSIRWKRLGWGGLALAMIGLSAPWWNTGATDGLDDVSRLASVCHRDAGCHTRDVRTLSLGIRSAGPLANSHMVFQDLRNLQPALTVCVPAAPRRASLAVVALLCTPGRRDHKSLATGHLSRLGRCFGGGLRVVSLARPRGGTNGGVGPALAL